MIAPPVDRMTLTAEILGETEVIRISAPMEGIDTVLETIERFIRAAGYNPEGTLTFVKEEEL